jgi:hypothetical protein
MCRLPKFISGGVIQRRPSTVLIDAPWSNVSDGPALLAVLPGLRLSLYPRLIAKIAMAYDIIGDIHGQADKLQGLLTHLGYRERDGAFRHPDPHRQVIFVGDFIDVGPRQIDTVMTVRRMVEQGTALAIMGNHEFNAIAWHTPDPESNNGEFLRPHSGSKGQENAKQHKAFLAEVNGKPDSHRELIDWFLTLPLWLDLPGLRVVHACWHDGYMNRLQPLLSNDRQLSREFVIAASRKGTMEFLAVVGLTKGLEIALPEGHSFVDTYGQRRYNVRIHWWDVKATTYRSLAIVPDDIRLQLPDIPVEAIARSSEDAARSPYDDQKPVFFGHYWMTGTPKMRSPTTACVDYSAAKHGPLVAYRWDGERHLNNAKFASFG